MSKLTRKSINAMKRAAQSIDERLQKLKVKERKLMIQKQIQDLREQQKTLR